MQSVRSVPSSANSASVSISIPPGPATSSTNQQHPTYSGSSSSNESSPERRLSNAPSSTITNNNLSRWYDLLQMVVDAMNSHGSHRASHHLHHSNSHDVITVEVDRVGGSSTNHVTSSTSSIMNGSSCVDGWQRKPLLKNEHNGAIAASWDDDGLGTADGAVVEYYDDEKEARSNGAVKITMPPPERDEPRFPREKWKTLVAFAFLSANWILTTVSLAIVHERLPDRNKYPPLPDVFFDLFQPLDWALDVSEVIIIVSVNVCVLVIILHRHRLIILRRVFLILGLLYMMRSVTMFVTQVPVASTSYYCSPKANSTSPLLVVKRVLQLLSGLGLSINGQHTYCGDYIYSGHTVILTMVYLIIREYAPTCCFFLPWLSWLFSLTGVVMVLLARGHYTVDVIIAYYVTTRVFWIYHTMCNNKSLKSKSSTNYIGRVWWFCIFEYFEKNVGGVIPRQEDWVLPWPRRLRKHNRKS